MTSNAATIVGDCASECPPAGGELLGKVIDELYRIDEIAGVGGMGTVYRALQLPSGRMVAFKVVNREVSGSHDVCMRFIEEAKIMANLEHPNSVALLDANVMAECGRMYIVSEFIEGETLAQRLKQGPLSVEDVIDMTHQILGAMIEAHGFGVVHADLKPDNIMLLRGDQGDTVKVVDFGVAYRLREENRRLHRQGVWGTPTYMAPEQIGDGAIDGRADLYSLGLIMYEALSGQLPFPSEDRVVTAVQRYQLDPRPLGDVWPGAEQHPGLTGLIMRLLSRDPKDRFGTAAECGAALIQLP